MAEMKTRYGKATYNDDDAAKQAVFDRVVAYFEKHQMLSGESIIQDDDAQIYAPEVLADIADDILQFEETED